MTTSTTTTANEIRISLDMAVNNENGDITVSELALATVVAQYGEIAVAAYVDNHNLHLDDATEWVDEFRDSYIGDMSPEEYAESFLDDLGDLQSVPDRLRYYIDYDKFARDMILSGDIWESDGYLFRG